MNCRRVQQQLSDHLEGLLPEREARALTVHLDHCARCRRLRADITAAGAELRELAAPLASSDLRQRAIERWIGEQAAMAVRQNYRLPWRTLRATSLCLAAAAMLLALLVFAVPWWGRDRSATPLAQVARHLDLLTRNVPEGTLRSESAKKTKRERAMAQRALAGEDPDESQKPRNARRVTGSSLAPSVSPKGSRLRDISLLSRFRVKEDRRQSLPQPDDLEALNGDPVEDSRPWTAVRADEWGVIERRVRRQVRASDDFVQIPFPRLVTRSDRQIAAAVESYKREAAVVDARLGREVTVQEKGIALSDLCDHLRSDSGIYLAAGRSVADEKVTLFCAKMPLREVMRQLSRPFGYSWVRSQKEGEYRYELMQDLRSQLLEEELRNRDRNASLLALEQEIERYRPYLSLSPDEALARLRGAAPADKKLIEQLSGRGWGPLHMYQRLSAQELAALRAGRELWFSAEPDPGQLPLPPDVARGVLQSLRQFRIRKLGDGHFGLTTDKEIVEAQPPANVPEARAIVTVKMRQSELGQLTLTGESGFFAKSSPGPGPADTANSGDDGPLAAGMSPTARQPENSVLNARLAHDPSLLPWVTLRPVAGATGYPLSGWMPGTTLLASDNRQLAAERKVSTADVLEALHRASGMPIIADYYTRLYKPEAVSARSQPLFDALNQLADAMRLRWNKDGGSTGERSAWLQFRSASYYDDRLKEVPNRLLARWASARRQRGMLSLEDLVEIGQLPDAQLDGAEMAEGARERFGLAEWGLARNWALRRHLRYLSGFTPAQRQEAMSPGGLSFTKMPLAQQQQFIATALEWDHNPLQSLEELDGAVLRVDYTQPGWFEWQVPGGADWLQYLMPAGSGRRVPRPPARARTREAALSAARQVDPQLQQEMVRVVRRLKPQFDVAQMAPQETQIVPTELNLTVLYVPGASHARSIRWFSFNSQTANGTW
jgi:hypothetical protein